MIKKIDGVRYTIMNKYGIVMRYIYNIAGGKRV